jgi:hypothetical protein
MTPERTVPNMNMSKKDKDFFQAIYRANMKKVRECLKNEEVDVHIADQVG